MIAEILLEATKVGPIVLIFGIGYWGLDRRAFSSLFYLLFLSMILNAFLKSIFQVPLKEHLNQQGWYAFPSGHMQLATAFYGQLFWMFRKKVWAYGIPLLLAGVGWALVAKDYHDPVDVIAAVGVGIALLVGYGVFERIPFVSRHWDQFGFLLLPITAFLIFFTKAPPEHIAHVWQAQGGLIGFSLGLTVFGKKILGPIESLQHSLHLWKKGMKILLGFGGFALFWITAPFLWKGAGYPWFPLGSFFVLGLWVSVGPDVILGSRSRPKI